MNSKSYMSLPYDLSGSISKNRFKIELLWGMHKILELYPTKKNFNVIFDYVCDVEVHFEDDKYEFYQIKTTNSGEAYTQNKLLSKGKKEKSVLAKLYIIKKSFSGSKENIKLFLVSNKPFKDCNKKIYKSIENLEYNNLDVHVREKIELELKEELQLENVDITNFSFVYTTMDLINPKDTLTGELVNFFDNVLKSEIKKPTVLYSVLIDKISERAEYEMQSSTYTELLRHKSISKDEITELFHKHIKISNNAVEKAKTFIETLYIDNYGKRADMILGLSSIVSKLNYSDELREKEKNIISFINNNKNILNDRIDNVISILYKKYMYEFNVEYSEDEIQALIILILMKREEGMYE